MILFLFVEISSAALGLSGYAKVFENPVQELVSNGNFHPQDIAYDSSTNQLVACPQSHRALYLINADTLEVEDEISHNSNYCTGVAVDDDNWYYTDYTGNNGYLWQCPKSTRTCSQTSAQIAGYGGVPISIDGNTMYRAALNSGGSGSTTYDWGNLQTLVQSTVSNPTSILSSCSLPDGTDAIAYAENNELLQMVWNDDTNTPTQPTLHLVDVDSCVVSESITFDDACDDDQNAAGVAYKPGNIYIFCYGGSSSTAKIAQYSGSGSSGTYSEYFPSGVVSSSASQCSNFNSFVDDGPDTIAELTLTAATGTFTCTDETVVNDIWSHLQSSNNPSDTTFSCDGHEWLVGTCGNGREIAAGATTANDCACDGDDIVLRPCINNQNWGGGNGGCGQSSQTLELTWRTQSEPVDPPVVVSSGTYSEYFPTGTVSSSSSQCSNFNSFIDDGPETVTQLTLTVATGTFTCTDSTVVNDIWSHLQSSSSPSEQTFSCDGNAWLVGYCGNGREIAAGATVDGDCSCNGDDIVLRPCINNGNWGGGNGGCSQSSQTMELTWISQSGEVTNTIQDCTDSDTNIADSAAITSDTSGISGDVVSLVVDYPGYMTMASAQFVGSTSTIDVPDWTVTIQDACRQPNSAELSLQWVDLMNNAVMETSGDHMTFQVDFLFIYMSQIQSSGQIEAVDVHKTITFSIESPHTFVIGVDFEIATGSSMVFDLQSHTVTQEGDEDLVSVDFKTWIENEYEFSGDSSVSSDYFNPAAAEVTLKSTSDYEREGVAGQVQEWSLRLYQPGDCVDGEHTERVEVDLYTSVNSGGFAHSERIELQIHLSDEYRPDCAQALGAFDMSAIVRMSSDGNAWIDSAGSTQNLFFVGSVMYLSVEFTSTLSPSTTELTSIAATYNDNSVCSDCLTELEFACDMCGSNGMGAHVGSGNVYNFSLGLSHDVFSDTTTSASPATMEFSFAFTYARRSLVEQTDTLRLPIKMSIRDYDCHGPSGLLADITQSSCWTFDSHRLMCSRSGNWEEVNTCNDMRNIVMGTIGFVMLASLILMAYVRPAGQTKYMPIDITVG